jgi:hypothetical protein
VPLNDADCGEPVTVAFAVIEAEAEPGIVGLKTMDRVQLELAGSMGTQVLPVRANSLAFVPVNRYEVTSTGVELLLETVNTCGADVLPTLVAGKVNPEVKRLTSATGVPVPLTATDCDPPKALSVATRVAEAGPAAVGLKM